VVSLKRISGFASIILVVIFWGISFISISIILEVVHPVILGFLRYVLAVIFVLSLALMRKMDFRITKSDFIIFFFAGLIGIFLYSSLENTALLYISSSAGAIFASLTPMSMTIGNRLVFKENIKPKHLIYIILSMLGVAMVVFSDLSLDLSWWSILGYGLMVLSIVSWTVYSVLTKKITRKYDSLKVTTIQAIMALIIFMPSLLLAPLPDFQAFTPNYWFHLLFLGIICSGVCYFLYIHAVDTLGLTVPNIFINFIPLVTIVTNSIIFKTSINGLQIIGGIVIILTMTLLTVDNFSQIKEKSLS